MPKGHWMNQAQEMIPVRLNLSEPVVEQAFVETEASLPIAKAEELAALQVHDKEGALIGLLAKLEDRPPGDVKIHFNALGFVVACKTIRYAARDVTSLPSLPTKAVDAYAAYGAYNPSWLDKNIERDYRAYPAIFKLIHSLLTDPNSQARAKLVFGLYGGFANPDRPKLEIPAVPSIPKQRQSSSASPERKRELKRINSASLRFS